MISVNELKDLVSNLGIKASSALQEQMQESRVNNAFDLIRKKLNTNVKVHLQKMEVSFSQKLNLYEDDNNNPIGTLKYHNREFYIKELDTDANVVPITPYDKALGYQFFMLRLITSSKQYPDVKPFEIQKNYVVLFDKMSTDSYTSHDVLQSFEYLDAKSNYISSHVGAKVSKEAFYLLKKDKEEFTKIIKTLFETYTIDCNVLKKVGEALKTQICANSFDVEDQDYFVQNVICHEIFTIASMDEFCPNLVLNHIDEL